MMRAAFATWALRGAAAVALAVATSAADAQVRVAEGDDGARRLIVRALDLDPNAQENATLEADVIEYNAATEVVRARGDVKIFYAGRVLRADEVIYDAKNDRISANGNISVTNPDGSVLTADSAEFDSEIRNGLIRGARAVLGDGAARIAAVEGRRVDARFTTLTKAVYSPCRTCVDGPTPLWRIRARRVTRDAEAKDIIYEDATFDLLGVPIAYLPYFRHADPSVKRRTGFLTPSFSSTSELGYTAKVPYYIELANNRDITITPFVMTEEQPALELEYRALETYGRYTLGGSATWSNESRNQGFRGHFDGDGVAALPWGVTAGFDALFASDRTYLRRYRFTSTDRATSDVYVRKYEETGFFNVTGSYLQSFRTDEVEGAGFLPIVAPHVRAEYRIPALGGEFGVNTDSVFLYQPDYNGPDENGLDSNISRSVGRLSFEAFWKRVMTTSGGQDVDHAAILRLDG